MKDIKNTQILRYSIDPKHTSKVIEAPKGAEIINLGFDPMRPGTFGIWIAANPDQKKTEKIAIARLQTGQINPYNATELDFLGSAIGLGNSNSAPGTLSPRTVHYFKAEGDAAAAILAQQELSTISIEDDATPDETGTNV